MQDAMTIWDSICHSQWFKQTSIVRGSVDHGYPELTGDADFVLEQRRSLPGQDKTLGHQELLPCMSIMLSIVS